MKGVFDVTFQSALDVFNYGLVLIYGLFLSVSIAGGCTEKRDKKLVALLCPVFLVLQSLFALTLGTDKTMQLYPLIVHLPLVLILTLALKKPLGVAVVSTCTAYLCCQPLRWGKNAVEALTGSMLAADIAYIVLLVGVFWLCERFLVKAAYATMTYSRWTLLLFGSLPVTYYIFDYATTVYSNALYSNVLIISEFLPTVLVTFYILFLPAFYLETQKRAAAEMQRSMLTMELEQSQLELERETDPHCQELQRDYIQFVQNLSSREAVSRRFFLIFEYEPFNANRKEEEREILAALETASQTAKTFLYQCGNEVVSHDNEDEFTTDVLYTLLNRTLCTEVPLSNRISTVLSAYTKENRMEELDHIRINEFLAPESVDFKHSHYVQINGLYHSYLLVPSDGYKNRVTPGWLSLLVNAGEGIDIDFFLQKQPKDKIQQRLGQQIRINRSKLKDASDTNTDYDDLDSAIRSGYFLKQGLANNEDFYYMNLLITITASTLEELQWRIQEMKKLLISQDMDLRSCYFLHNNSLVIADIFDSRQYKNSNICILGCSGAGKTFTMQTMALRMRRKGIQVFIIAPLKGHEFYRAARNVGGEFIQISPASKNCINIMEIRKVDNSVNELLDGPTLDASALAGKIQRLHIFFSLLIPDMSHEEKQLLDEALIKTYARKGITHKNESLTDPQHPEQYKKMPILEDVYNVLLESEDTKRLAHILNRLVHGSASSFNQQTNVDLTNKYTVLDISELTGSSDLLTVGMFVALDYVWDKAKENRTEEKAIFVDEVWQLIGASSNRLAAEFVLEIAKIIRAYSGAGIFATQDLNDFFALDDGKYGKGIINNCKTKIILNMEDEEAQRVKTILHLSETEVMNITHFQRGNGLISTNNNNITVEFKASNLEKELITTDRQELLEILAKQKKQAV